MYILYIYIYIYIAPFGCLYFIALRIVILHPTAKAGKEGEGGGGIRHERNAPTHGNKTGQDKPRQEKTRHDTRHDTTWHDTTRP